MPISLNDPTTFSSAVLIGDTGEGGSPPVMTDLNGIPIAAALEIQSTLGALVLPRMTDPSMQALFPTVDGMIVYNTTNNAVYFHQGGNWVPESGSGGGSVTSITQGTNIILSPSPIVTTGSVSLNPVLTGITSAVVGSFTISTNVISTADSNFNISATSPVSNLNLTASTNIFLNSGTAGAGNVNITNGARLLLFNNSDNAFIALRADPTLASSASYILPTALPVSNGQVLASTTGGTMSWVSLGSGSVTSITVGSNLNASPNPIVATGTISLSNTPSGLTSIGVGSIVLSSTTIVGTGALGLSSTGSITLTANSGTPGAVLSLQTTLWTASKKLQMLTNAGVEFFNSANTGSTTISAAAAQPATTIAYTLPTAVPASNGQVLSATTGGVMSWITAAGTVTSITQAANIVCTPNPITGAGTIGLNPVLTGLTSAAFTNFTMGMVSSVFQLESTNNTILSLVSPASISYDATSGHYFSGAAVNIESGIAAFFFPPTGPNIIGLRNNGASSSVLYNLPSTAPTDGQVLSATTPVATVSQLSWITAGSGSVSSVTGGTNLTGGTITTTGTLALNPVVTGLTSLTYGHTLFSTGTLQTGADSIYHTPSNSTPFLIASEIGITLFPTYSGAAGSVFIEGNLEIRTYNNGGNYLSIWNSNNTVKSGFKANNLTTNSVYTLPINGFPSVSGQVLASDTSGQMSWTNASAINASAKFILQQADGSMTNAQAMGALATGIVKNTTTTGVQSIAVAGTDYYAPGLSAGTAAISILNVGATSNANVYIDNTSNAPTTPATGGILYVQAGQLMYIGSSGTVTTIAPA